MVDQKIRDLLEEGHDRFNRPEFIGSDPIFIPHQYSNPGDIEVSGFLTSLLSWGHRKMIIKKALELMRLMDDEPYNFIRYCRHSDLKRFERFVYRTFQSVDVPFFIFSLQNIYSTQGSLQPILVKNLQEDNMAFAIHALRQELLQEPHLLRTRKHLPDPLAGSAAKRINMFLRWMVRKDHRGVDFGLWDDVSSSQLRCPWISILA